jgi:signal transduction histidine kinase
MARRANPSRGGARIASGSGLLVVSGLLFARAALVWPGDDVVWPAAAAVLGAFLIWRAPASKPTRHRGWALKRLYEKHASGVAAEPAPGPSAAAPAAASAGRARGAALPDVVAPAAAVPSPAVVATAAEAPYSRSMRLPQVSGRGLGVALVLAAGLAFVMATGAVRPAGEAALAALAVLVAVALIFAPSWSRLTASLAAEEAERIRSQERADVGAHLHDSVLQTLALIQRSAEDPREVATLARRQERELRAWLSGEDAERSEGMLGGALEAAAIDVETAAGTPIEVVRVGDRALDEHGGAVVAAAREAMLNAARHAPGARISVYAELTAEQIHVFVRDSGPGFDLDGVAASRRGVRESIIGRMRRAGGSATVRAAPGGGTEVELTLGRGGAGLR